ncbi:hypothetical protein CX658_05315 [Pseudomonas amygdali pv. lachrymans]|nr:hypothetical protein CX658_05315 [Pseudomonas amygdali pv. lachrymans]
MSAFAVAHPQISCIASLLWRSVATLALLLHFVAIPANIFCMCPQAVRPRLIFLAYNCPVSRSLGQATAPEFGYYHAGE